MYEKDLIKIAQQKITGNITPNTNSFHQTSFIYKTSNENFTLYENLYNNKKSLLTIEGSGDQILNAVAKGITDITAFDISAYPRYFTDLKLATILACKKEDFEEFFYQLYDYEKDFNEEIFELVCNKLKNCNFPNWNPQKSLSFWNSLFNFFDGYEIYNSYLFSSEPFSLSNIKEKNLFLNSSTYTKIKNTIPDLKLTHQIGNITEIVKNHSKEYDLINLSNIISYPLDNSNTISLKKYLKLLKNLPLSKDGIAITYLFNLTEDLKAMLNKEFQFENYEIITKENTCQQAAVLVYKKN